MVRGKRYQHGEEDYYPYPSVDTPQPDKKQVHNHNILIEMASFILAVMLLVWLLPYLVTWIASPIHMLLHEFAGNGLPDYSGDYAHTVNQIITPTGLLAPVLIFGSLLMVVILAYHDMHKGVHYQNEKEETRRWLNEGY